MAKVIVHRPEIPKAEDLRKMYDVFNKIFKDEELFYTPSEVTKLKKNTNNIFLT